MTTTRCVLDFIHPPSAGRVILGAFVLLLAVLVLAPPAMAGTVTGASINGAANVGVQLRADATGTATHFSYQWQSGTSGSGPWTNIGTNSRYYTVQSSDVGKYIHVTITGTSGDTGSATSSAAGPVKIVFTDIGDPTGTLHPGSSLTAGALTPSGATVTYQWQESSHATYGYTNVGGATSSTYPLTVSDEGMYLRVVAIAYGDYTGTQTSDHVGPVQTPLDTISAPTGTTQYNSVLTHGTVSPGGATVNYRWYESNDPEGSFTYLQQSYTYTLQSSDVGMYIKCYAVGTGDYYGTINSTAVGPVITIPLVSVDDPTGTVQVGHTLTSGAITPSGAYPSHVSYQWQNATTQGGSYTDILGANSRTYDLTADDFNKYYRVNVTGENGYSGTVTSSEVGPVAPQAVTNINILGTARVDQTLSAGSITPSEATVTYQWENSTSGSGPWTAIAGATSDTFPLQAIDYGRYYHVVATGTGAYFGIATSSVKGPVAPAPVTAVGPTTGTPQAYYNLTAGAVTPSDATVTYQWEIADAENGPYTPISGEIYDTTLLNIDEYGKYIEVYVTGTGSYIGSVNSTASGPIYMPPPVITSLSPASGQQAITTAVTITGTNFTGADHVYFGATEVSFTPVDNSHITTASPVPGTGVVDVTVHTPTGTSALSAADHFKYGVEKEIGIYKDGVWYLDANKNGFWDGPSTDFQYNFGVPGNVPVVGDWNGNGKTKIGVTDGINWYLDANGNGIWDGTGPGGDKYAYFGLAGYTPIVGDWNGDGTTEIGVTDGFNWYLDANGNGNWDGTGPGGDKYAYFGIPGYTPIVGDWNGDGTTEIGVTDGTHWYLDSNGNGNWDGVSGGDQYGYFGIPGYTPIVGDWNGDSRTKIGVTDGIHWYLDANGNGNWDGVSGGDQYGYFGIPPTYVPLVGDWNGDGKDKIAVTNDVYWYLDANGNGNWDGTPTDKAPYFGIAGWTPVVGTWS